MPTDQLVAHPAGWDWTQARAVCAREARRILRDPHDADEAVQEAMARAWNRRASCTSPEAPLPWIAQIARNESLRALQQRRQRWGRELPHEDSPQLPAHDERLAASIDRVSYVQRLARLTAEDRLIMHLRYAEDRSQPEIAELVGMPEGTVKVRLHRARKRIREEVLDELARG